MNQEEKLKRLIEDLLHGRLTELQIQKAMEQLGFVYSSNPTTRWKLLLEKLGSEPQERLL